MAGAGGAFGGNRGLQPVPPEKGVFPLDHLHECDETMVLYMKCLKEHKYESEKCKEWSKMYLECRMDRNLMVKQDLRELGFRDTKEEGEAEVPPQPAAQKSREKLQGGFVSGISGRSQ